MDTKSTKSKYSISSKIICFILSCIFVAIGAIGFLKISFTLTKDYSTLIDAITYSKDVEIDETNSFANAFKNDAETIMLNALYYKDGSLETFKKVLIKDVKQKYNDFISHIYSPYFGEDESIESMSEYTTFTYICTGTCQLENDKLEYFDEEHYNVQTPENADRIWMSSSDDKIYSLKFDKTKIYQICFNDIYKQFSSEYSQNKYNLSLIRNLKFAVINSTDKTVITNIDSLNSKSSKANIEKIFNEYSWDFSLNSNGTFLASDEIKSKINIAKVNSVYAKDFDYYEYYNSETPMALIAYVEKAISHFTYNCGSTLSTPDNYTVYFAMDKNLSSGTDSYSTIFSEIKTARNELLTYIPITVISLILTVACIIFLIITSGRKEKSSEIKLIKTDEHLTILHLCASFTAFASFISIPFVIVEDQYKNIDRDFDIPTFLIYFAFVGFFVLANAILIEWAMSFTRNIKNKSFFRNTLIGKLIKKYRFFSDKVKPFSNKNTFIIICVASIGILFLIFAFAIAIVAREKAFIIPLMLLCAILVTFIIISTYYLGKISTILENAKQGKYEEHFNAYSFPFWMRSLANEVANMQDGTKNAIESAIKDQKMKTELITNVSHDLKTPLTAVINYVDLLSKCDLNDEKTKEYLDVISEKSDRLKKLIEDLTEAAKASSGNIQVNNISLNLNEIAYQISGETENEFKEKNLEIILKIPENPVIVNADSKLTFRVLENLMSNALKYAMPNTRVYFIVDRNGSITINNVSKEVLDITPEELKSRFVRGDKSRSTEGSGLGLSIADDLCKIQNAKLEIFIEGDLFKAVVSFSN